MNNILLILCFVFWFNVTDAKNSFVSEDTSKTTHAKYTEADIHIDSDTIESKTFSKKFKEKYNGSEFVYEYKTPEKNWWDHFKEWLASLLKDLFNFSSNETSMNFVSVFLKTLAVLIVVFVIYLIAKALINKEGQWIFGKDSNKKTIQYTDIEKNIHLLDFKKLIKESLQSGEKRIAIRYYYLWLLKVMAQNYYIEWDIEKTNSDYLYELKNPDRKEDFKYLSYLFNYIWYGEFEIDDVTFQKAENRFKNAIKTFSNE